MPISTKSQLPTPRRALSVAAALTLATLLLAACGDTEKKDDKQVDAGPKMPASPTIATLGKEEIKAYELANEMRLAGVPLDKDKRDDQTTKRIMRELVQRKFLAQKAVAQKLDQDPGFVIEAARAREQMLANAYLQKSVSDKWVTESQVYRYQLDHPLMFEKRQVVGIDQVTVPMAGNEKAIVEATKTAKSLDDVVRALTSLGVNYGHAESEIASGDIPPELFAAIEKKKSEDVFFLSRGSTGVFFVAKRFEPKPLTGEPATLLAKRMLLNEMFRQKASEKPLDADVRYEGDLERIMKLPDAPPPAKIAPPASAAPDATRATAPAPAAPAPAAAAPAAPAAKGKPDASKDKPAKK